MANPLAMAISSRYNHDPLAAWNTVPANETPEERRVREAREEEARRISKRIDDELNAERAALKKKEIVKVLILGQSESGKSTTIKNFQLAYAYQAWMDDRLSWRSVIFLNLVRSVNKILSLLTLEMSTQLPTPVSSQPPSPLTSQSSASRLNLSGGGVDAESDTSSQRSGRPLRFTEHHKLLSMRLSPLVYVQADLEAHIGSGASEVVSPGASRTHLPEDALADAAPFADEDRVGRRLTNEFAVRSSWKDTLSKLRTRMSLGHERRLTEKKLAEVIGILMGCSADIKDLWTNKVVQEVLRRRNVRLEDSAGFFLDDVDRIVSSTYEPTDNDVLRARLRTVGVQEYSFILERGLNDETRSPDRFGREVGRQWKMFDVGGSRTSREAWYPYFDDINAIIFLAPISCFDEFLDEDPEVNRIKDSLLLWKGICGSKLLTNVQFVLFLNKCDILWRKLQNSEAKVKDHFPAFGDRPQDGRTVGEYFRSEFRQIMKQSHNPNKQLYAHMTSVTHVKSTSNTLRSVRDGIVRELLSRSALV